MGAFVSAHNIPNEQGVDFDRDLARLDQIRRSHKSARPTHENPAWMNTHADCAFLLGFIDSLWGAYTGVVRKHDVALDALRRAAKEMEMYVDLQQQMDYIEYAARSQKELDAVNVVLGLKGASHVQ
jgi:hypothetical protein